MFDDDDDDDDDYYYQYRYIDQAVSKMMNYYFINGKDIDWSKICDLTHEYLRDQGRESCLGRTMGAMSYVLHVSGFRTEDDLYHELLPHLARGTITRMINAKIVEVKECHKPRMAKEKRLKIEELLDGKSKKCVKYVKDKMLYKICSINDIEKNVEKYMRRFERLDD